MDPIDCNAKAAHTGRAGLHPFFFAIIVLENKERNLRRDFFAGIMGKVRSCSRYEPWDKVFWHGRFVGCHNNHR
jgi:hypothetical protein